MGSTKPAEEILFSHKKNRPYHPPLKFNNIEVKRVTEHKHLGLIFDPKLSFLKHITEKVGIAQKGIGLIKHLALYLPVKSRDQIFKMHVRPHLDYCDLIYHIPIKTNEMSDGDSQRNLNYLMETLESTQYQAALAVSGAWKGTSQDKIYNELGWETLDERRMFRRLVQFYKIMTNQTPDYLRLPIQSQHCHLFGVRFGNVLKDIKCESYRYRNSFFPDSVSMWNDLGPKLRESKSISKFKDTLIKLYRPVKKSIFNVHDGIKWIFQLRVELSPLKSHKKSHKFAGYEEPLFAICSCSMGIAETTIHFLPIVLILLFIEGAFLEL